MLRVGGCGPWQETKPKTDCHLWHNVMIFKPMWYSIFKCFFEDDPIIDIAYAN